MGFLRAGTGASAPYLVLVAALLMVRAGDLVAGGGYAEFLNVLAMLESGGKPMAVNHYGYAGLYQMGEAGLIDAGYYKPDATPSKNDWVGTWTGKNGINNLADFLKDPNQQNQAVTDYHQKLWSYIQNMGLDSYSGKTVAGTLITNSGLIAGAHLVGARDLQKFLASGGMIVPKDANGTPITKYISSFGGYAIGLVAPPRTPGPIVNAPTLGQASLPVPPAAILVPPETAFYMTTGATPADVELAVGMLLSTFLFLWVVWTSVSRFNSWRKGQLAMINLQWDLVRALTVLMVLVVIVQ
jgi:integrating conjugative element protein (TIGR03758 family)